MPGTNNARALRRQVLSQRAARAADLNFGIAWGEHRGRRVLQWSMPDDPASALMCLPELRRELEEVELGAVVRCRLDGDSWEQIGALLGVTGTAVRVRLGDQVEAVVSEQMQGTP
jgi:hypothetical protein